MSNIKIYIYIYIYIDEQFPNQKSPVRAKGRKQVGVEHQPDKFFPFCLKDAPSQRR